MKLTEKQGLYISDLIKYLKETIPFSEYESSLVPFEPYIPRFEVIMRVGTIPLVKAGWLEKTKNGRWFITTFGRNACYKYSNTDDIFSASIQAINEWKVKEEKRLEIFDSNPYNNAQEFAAE